MKSQVNIKLENETLKEFKKYCIDNNTNVTEQVANMIKERLIVVEQRKKSANKNLFKF